MGGETKPAASSHESQAKPLLGKRCLIVEDRADIARGEARLLELAGASCTIVGTIGEARAAAAREQWALMIVDLRLPDGYGSDFVREMAERKQPTALIILSGYLELRASTDLYELGAVPLHKEDLEGKDLVTHAETAMRRAARLQRERAAEPASRPLAKCGSATEAFARRFRFTKREREAFDLLVDEVSPKEIAYRIGRAPATVRGYIEGACRKVGVASQRELIARYARSLAEEPPWAASRDPATGDSDGQMYGSEERVSGPRERCPPSGPDDGDNIPPSLEPRLSSKR